MNVLVVDDNAAARRSIRKALLNSGLSGLVVAEAENGCDALAKLGDVRPDLILCDWRMPEMSGIDLLRELRARGSRVAFGFVSREMNEQMREIAFRSGARFVLEGAPSPAKVRALLAGETEPSERRAFA